LPLGSLLDLLVQGVSGCLAYLGCRVPDAFGLELGLGDRRVCVDPQVFSFAANRIRTVNIPGQVSHTGTSRRFIYLVFGLFFFRDLFAQLGGYLGRSHWGRCFLSLGFGFGFRLALFIFRDLAGQIHVRLLVLIFLCVPEFSHYSGIRACFSRFRLMKVRFSFVREALDI
jgi:hypothetical protein